MKKFFILTFVLLLASVVMWQVGCKKDINTTSPTTAGDVSKTGTKVETATPPGGGGGNPGGGQNGTTLSDNFPVTCACFNYFDWSCVKTMGAGPYIICKGATDQEIPVVVTVTKGAQHIGYTGTIIITNGGGVATEGLKVGATLMYHDQGGFVASTCAISGLEVQHPILAAGESYTYIYTINAVPGCLISDNNAYRIDGNVTILNHSGSIGTPKGPKGKSDSYQLCPPSNDCVDVTDVPGTPFSASLQAPDATSWTITVTTQNPVNVCQSGDVPFTLLVHNVNAPNEETWTVTNTATVDNHTCEANFELSTVGCTPPDLGCSYTQGFWKTHGCVGPKGKSQYGHNPDLISPLLGTPIVMGIKTITTCSDAGAVFQGAQGNQGNAIKRLYSQMLAALLNKANGADGSCIAQTIIDANAVLIDADPLGDASGWTGINGANRAAVQSAAAMFDRYNNGLECVPHCE